MIDIGFSKLLLLGTFTFVIYYLMKRGFLNSEKAKKAALGVGATGKRVVKISHQALEEKDKPHGFTPSDAFSNYVELDGAKLDHDAEMTVFTTIPSRNNDMSTHSAAEHRDQWTEAIVDGATKRQIFTQPGFPKPVERPAIPVHRIASAGEGKGLGVFATRDIKPGALILAERPILLVPLCVPHVEGLPGRFTLEQIIQARLAEWEKGLELAVGRMLPERREAFMKLANSHERDGSGPILGRVRTNGIGASGLHYQGEKGPEGQFSATCEVISRVNHSCSPNAQYSFNRPTFSARLRAVRHIKAGEEITITYANLDVPFAQRQKELAPYGFTCTCAACKEGAASDARRAKIPSAIDVGTKLSLPELLEMMTLIEREGLEDMPVYLDAMMRITEAYQVQKDWTKCALYAKKVQAFLPMETDGDDDE